MRKIQLGFAFVAILLMLPTMAFGTCETCSYAAVGTAQCNSVIQYQQGACDCEVRNYVCRFSGGACSIHHSCHQGPWAVDVDPNAHPLDVWSLTSYQEGGALLPLDVDLLPPHMHTMLGQYYTMDSQGSNRLSVQLHRSGDLELIVYAVPSGDVLEHNYWTADELARGKAYYYAGRSAMKVSNDVNNFTEMATALSIAVFPELGNSMSEDVLRVLHHNGYPVDDLVGLGR